MTTDPDHPDQLDDAVKTRRERRQHWRAEGERPIGRNIALIGALGWAIVVPTLLGLFAGRWLDREFDSGLFWTLGLLVVGLTAGCALAWKRMQRE